MTEIIRKTIEQTMSELVPFYGASIRSKTEFKQAIVYLLPIGLGDGVLDNIMRKINKTTTITATKRRSKQLRAYMLIIKAKETL